MRQKFYAAIILSLAAGPALAFDDCLVGVWTPDLAALQTQFERNPNMGEVQVSGNIQMVLSAEMGEYDLNGLKIAVKNPGAPEVEVTMSGTGSFSVLADEGRFDFHMATFNYSAQATVDIGGSVMNMDIPFTDEMSPMGNGAAGTYSCDASSVTFHSNTEGKLVNLWHRQ